MKNIVAFVLFAFVSICSAQTNGVLSGKIVDAETHNEPLLMASVSLKNTAWKTQTNFNGNFEIKAITPGAYTLEVAFLGYETIAIPVAIKAGERLELLEVLQAKSLPTPVSLFVAEKNDITTAGLEISGLKK